MRVKGTGPSTGQILVGPGAVYDVAAQTGGHHGYVTRVTATQRRPLESGGPAGTGDRELDREGGEEADDRASGAEAVQGGLVLHGRPHDAGA